MALYPWNVFLHVVVIQFFVPSQVKKVLLLKFFKAWLES